VPKTHQARSVPVPAFLSDRLVAHIAGVDLRGFVFAAPRGGVLRVNLPPGAPSIVVYAPLASRASSRMNSDTPRRPSRSLRERP
jgi:hypothetical protein